MIECGVGEDVAVDGIAAGIASGTFENRDSDEGLPFAVNNRVGVPI
jgi:hypothetical protein